MTVTCPNCGKPVRQGAKFCGNCRAELPANLSVTPVARPTPGAQATPPAGGVLCPKCGTIVRQGARFCPRCGNQIQAQPAAQQHPPSIPLSRPPSQGVSTPQPASRGSGQSQPQPAAASKPARKIGTRSLIILAVLLLLCCAFGATAALTQDRWMPQVGAVLGKATGAPSPEPSASPVKTQAATDVAATPAAPTAAATTPVVVTPSVAATTPAADITQEPVAVQPTTDITPKVMTTSLPPVLKTSAAPEKTALIKEDFSKGTLDQWSLSGEPAPEIQKEGETAALVFQGEDAIALFDEAFDMKAGTMIEFVLEVDPDETQMMHFRWAPGETAPADLEQQSSVKIDIDSKNMHFVMLRAEDNVGLTQDVKYAGPNLQTYKLVVNDDLSVSFWVNNSKVYAARDRIFPSTGSAKGFMAFSGKGKLHSVTVIEK